MTLEKFAEAMQHVEFIYKNEDELEKYGYSGPGWYFWDPFYYLYGPYKTARRTVMALNVFCRLYL